jgi:hypothetical protein
MPVERISKTANDVLIAVKRQFGDSSGTQVNNAHIFAWTNDAQREIVKENPEIRKDMVQVNVVANTATYPLLTHIPDMMVVHSILYRGTMLRNMSFVEAQEYIIRGDAADQLTAEPTLWYEYAGTITLWPVPSVSYTAGLTIFYSSSPDEVEAAGDVLGVPDAYFNALVSYCMWKAYEMDDNMSAGEAMMRQFYESVIRLSNRQEAKNDRYPTVIQLPEDYYY